MAFALGDRVRESSTTTGTGAVALAGAPTGFRTFASVLGSGDTCWYAITMGGDWEIGLGTFTAPSTLARTTVLASSNAGALVNFVGGTKDVFITVPASILQKLRGLRGAFAVDRNGVDQTGLSASAYNKILFTNKVSDVDNWFDTATSRYTPQEAGLYLFTVRVRSLVGSSGETPQAALFKNGTIIGVGDYQNGGIPAGNNNNKMVSVAARMNGTTDYVEGHVYMPGGVTTLLGVSTAVTFAGSRIGD